MYWDSMRFMLVFDTFIHSLVLIFSFVPPVLLPQQPWPIFKFSPPLCHWSVTVRPISTPFVYSQLNQCYLIYHCVFMSHLFLDYRRTSDHRVGPHTSSIMSVRQLARAWLSHLSVYPTLRFTHSFEFSLDLRPTMSWLSVLFSLTSYRIFLLNPSSSGSRFRVQPSAPNPEEIFFWTVGGGEKKFFNLSWR
jgi:hypothetical protein